MSKYSIRKVILALAVAAALPGAAQAGPRDCVNKVMRDVDHGVTRVVHHTGRMVSDMFRWTDRRKT